MRPTPTGGIPIGGACHGDQLRSCGLCAPVVSVRPIPVISPVVASYPGPDTSASPPFTLKVKTHGPEGAIAVMEGSTELIDATQVFTVGSLMKSTEITCELPSESYTLIGTEKGLPAVA